MSFKYKRFGEFLLEKLVGLGVPTDKALNLMDDLRKADLVATMALGGDRPIPFRYLAIRERSNEWK